MAEGVTGRMRDDPCLTGSDLERPLDNGLLGVMAALRAHLGVDPPMLLGEGKLPAPFRRGVGVFAGEHIGLVVERNAEGLAVNFEDQRANATN